MESLESLPLARVALDAAPLPPGLADALASLVVRSRVGAPTQCELRFDDPPRDAVAGASAWMAQPLSVDAPISFAGEVVAIEMQHGANGRFQLWVRAYDALHRLRREQPVRLHVDRTVAEIARELAGAQGLRVRARAEGPFARERAQVREDDLAFLDRIAREAGLQLAAHGDELLLLTAEGDGAPTRLELGKELLELHAEQNGEPAAQEVVAHGWSPPHARPSSGRASAGRSGRATPSGASLPAAVGAKTVVLTERGGDHPDQARHAAQAEADRRLASAFTIRALAEGQPGLHAGSVVELDGAAPALCGRHVLTEVEHRLDASRGFVSALSSEPPRAPLARTGAILSLGEVTRVDDPEDLGRVRVALPAYGGIEPDWMPVVCPGASPKHGLAHLPDVGDRVAVLFAHEDVAEGVVLGGLFGEGLEIDSGVAGTRRRRFAWQSPSGQRIQLDDEDGAMRLDATRLRVGAASGSRLTVDEDQLALRAKTDLLLEAPGHRIVIRAARVEFEEAGAQESPSETEA